MGVVRFVESPEVWRSHACSTLRVWELRIERNKLVALITIEVHARDVQDRMIAA